MNINAINAPDAELADLIQRPDVIIPIQRPNPVGQRLQQPQQPQTIRPLINVNNWTPNMPANGGYRTTSKNSKKYKNKNRKYKNRKRRQTKRLMKKRKH